MPHQDVRQNIVKRGSIQDLYGLLLWGETARKRSAVEIYVPKKYEVSS
jgi:hypothetical protein